MSLNRCFRALLWMVLLLAVRAEGGDWPQWRGPNRTGVWNEKGILEKFPTNGLKFSWRAAVGRGWSSPIVAKGRVFVTDVELTPPKARERVLCFDEKNGKLLWTYAYAAEYPDWAFTPDTGGPRATPLVHDRRLFTLGALGHLFCLDAASGSVLWTRNLATDYQVKEFTGITASPLIEKNLLILNIYGKPAASVVAFDTNSGKEKWRALDDAFTYSSQIVLVAGRRRQLITWTQDAVTSLNPATGQLWWRELVRTSGDTAVPTPVFEGNHLLIGGLMLKLDAQKPAATVLWPESKAPSKRILSNTSSALLQNHCVFSVKYSGDLVCLDAETGLQLWQTNSVTHPQNGASIHLTPNGDSVLLFTDQGNLIRARLSRQGYQELSRVHVLDPSHSFGGRGVLWPAPAYANRHIFARNDKELICASLAAKP